MEATPTDKPDLPFVMLIAPVRDRAWILQDWLEHIYALDYPKEKLSIVLLFNNCTDASISIARSFFECRPGEYRRVDFQRMDVHNAASDKRNQRKFTDAYCRLACLRNYCLHQLKDEEYIFSIDSDILPDAHTLRRLLQHDKDICAALVPNNATETAFNILDWNPKDPDTADHLRHFPKPALIKVGVTGACYLIHRKVVDSGVVYGYHRQGEDIYFCKMAQQRGFELWCDTGLPARHIMRKEDY